MFDSDEAMVGVANVATEQTALKRAIQLAIADELRQIVEPTEFSVIVISDDPQRVSVVENALRNADDLKVHITVTGSLDSASRAIELVDFDVVISDIVVRGEHGVRLFRDYPWLPTESAAIALGSSPTPGAVAHALACGSSAVVDVSCITGEALVQSIRQALIRREMVRHLSSELLGARVEASICNGTLLAMLER